MMDTKALRAKLLGLAVRGKLVPQVPGEESAAALLRCEDAGRARPLRAERRKSPASTSRIFRRQGHFYETADDREAVCIDDRLPFDIPASWEWCRLGRIFRHNTGKALNASHHTGTKLSYITASDLHWDRFELSHPREMWFTDAELEKCTAQEGDLLVCEGGDIGRAAVWQSPVPVRIQNHIHRLRAYSPLCTRFYLYVFYFYKLAGVLEGSERRIQNLSSERLHSLLLPVAPLDEQRRIVEKLDACFAQIKRIEGAESALKNDCRAAKSRILDLAIRGKLVPRVPHDEPAPVPNLSPAAHSKPTSRPVRRDGKSYPTFPNGSARDVSGKLPFDIPTSWFLSKMGNLMSPVCGVKYAKSDIQGEGIRILRGGNLTQSGGIIFRPDDVFLPEKYANRKNQVRRGDIVIVASTGGKTGVGRAAFVVSDLPRTQIGGFLRIIRPVNDYCRQLLWLVFRSNYYRDYIAAAAVGTSINNVRKPYLEEMLVPLPPVQELSHIVQKLDSLLARIPL